MRTIYEKYAKLRDEKGITDYRVAKDLGFSFSFLSDWGAGKYEPKLPKLKKLADYFDVPVTYFID